MRGQDNRSRESRVNERIRAREVRVIDDEGQMLGVMTPLAALNMARDRGMDLVEVQPMAQPPVCKIMDWGRFKYEQSKKESEARKHQKVTQLREIRMKPRTGEHDIDVKVRKIQEFLGDGDKVKVSVTFKGREMAHTELGRSVLDEITQELKGIAQIERPPIMEGRMMSMIVSKAPGWDPKKTPAAAAPQAERPADEQPVAATNGRPANEPPAADATPAPAAPAAAASAPASAPAPASAAPRPAPRASQPRPTAAPTPAIEEPAAPSPAGTAQ
jgi:translation initiation factor IF-3